jgi:hypothetical protein
LPEIPKIQQSYFLTSFGIVFFYNLSITLFDLFNDYYRTEKIQKFRSPANQLDLLGTKPIVWLERLTLLFAFIMNVYVMFKCIEKGYYFFIPYFLLYLLRYLVNLLQNVIYDLVNMGFLKNFARMIEDARANIVKEKVDSNRMKFSLLKILFSKPFHLILTAYIAVYVFSNITLTVGYLKLALDGLAITLFLLLIQFLFVIFYKRMKIAWLEKLEREIIQHNLNQRAIIQKLNEGYFNLSKIDDYF